MPSSLLRTGAVLLLGASAMLAGCGSWGPEKYEAAAVAAVDSRLTTGMSVAELREQFPAAQSLSGDDRNGAWLVYEQNVCFWCRTRHGFVHSLDTFARVAHFENGGLVRIEPAQRVRSNVR